MASTLRFNLLGNEHQRLRGFLNGEIPQHCFEVLAVPDTGAEANVIDKGYADAKGLHIQEGPDYCNILQFADGTCQKPIGQVDTYWTFESGKRIPVTLEVFEDCCADVVLGDSILYDQNVFEDHASSIIELQPDCEMYQLAPFGVVKNRQRRWKHVLDYLKPTTTQDRRSRRLRASLHKVEERRQERWNYRFSFGETASEAEKFAEDQRRTDHLSKLQPGQPPTPIPESQRGHVYRVPSIAASPGHSQQLNPAIE